MWEKPMKNQENSTFLILHNTVSILNFIMGHYNMVIYEIYAFVRHFFPKENTVHLIQTFWIPWKSNQQPFGLLSELSYLVMSYIVICLNMMVTMYSLAQNKFL